MGIVKQNQSNQLLNILLCSIIKRSSDENWQKHPIILVTTIVIFQQKHLVDFVIVSRKCLRRIQRIYRWNFDLHSEVFIQRFAANKSLACISSYNGNSLWASKKVSICIICPWTPKHSLFFMVELYPTRTNLKLKLWISKQK